ncbi:MAG: hypothetical protein R3335_06130 [Anaerolineales bacterium]|nr:hypothetical protein [Anaerolineales bacterium]
MRIRRWRIPGIVLAIGLAAPILVHGLLAIRQFDGLYGQDPFAYFGYAVGPLRESVLAGRLPPPFFWPPGYPIAVLGVTAAIGTLPLAGQIVSLASAATLPILTYILARSALPSRFHPPAPLLAGLMVALNPQLWQSSIVVMSDTLALAAATAGILCFSMAFSQVNARRTLILVGLGTGWMALAVLTRWAYLLPAVPTGLFIVILISRQSRRTGVIMAALGLIIGLVVLWPVLSPQLSGLLKDRTTSGAFIGDITVYSWEPANALRRQFFTADGLLSYRLPNGLYYSLAPAHNYFFTPLLAVFLLPGAYSLFRYRSLQYTLLIGGWAGIIFLFHAGAPWQNFRFTLAYLPPIAIITSAGIAWVLAEVPHRWRTLVWMPVGLGLLWMVFGAINLPQSFIERKKQNLAIVESVEEAVPSDAEVIAFNLTLMADFYTGLKVHELYYLDQAEISGLVSGAGKVYLLLTRENILAQWQGRPPGDNLLWLESNRSVVEVQNFGEYGLFEVQEP